MLQRCVNRPPTPPPRSGGPAKCLRSEGLWEEMGSAPKGAEPVSVLPRRRSPVGTNNLAAAYQGCRQVPICRRVARPDGCRRTGADRSSFPTGRSTLFVRTLTRLTGVSGSPCSHIALRGPKHPSSAITMKPGEIERAFELARSGQYEKARGPRERAQGRRLRRQTNRSFGGVRRMRTAANDHQSKSEEQATREAAAQRSAACEQVTL